MYTNTVSTWLLESIQLENWVNVYKHENAKSVMRLHQVSIKLACSIAHHWLKLSHFFNYRHAQTQTIHSSWEWFYFVILGKNVEIHESVCKLLKTFCSKVARDLHEIFTSSSRDLHEIFIRLAEMMRSPRIS